MFGIRTSLWLVCVAFATAAGSAGCSGDTSVNGSKGSEGAQDPPTGSTGKDGGAKDAGKRPDAATSTSRDAAIDKGDDSVTGSIPCDVAPLIATNCTLCHGKVLSGGAPMPLLTLSDFHKMATTDATRAIYDLAIERMQDDVPLRMPPASVDISNADEQAILAWLKGGAKGSSDDCTPDTGGDAGTAGSDAGGGAAGSANQITGTISIDPLTYDDPDIKCYPFLAYAKNGDRSKPYQVPTTPDYYVDFVFKAPFTGTQYIKYFKSHIDNAAVLHHWLFYQQSSASAESVTENAIGAHPDGDLIAGWAPGGSDMYYAADTGMQISGGVSYEIETHYNNKTGAVAADASGLELCVTPNKPAHVAALAWLGTDSINGISASGTCRPSTTQPVHLIAGQPHMHLKGRHMKVILNRAGGTSETIHDDDFDFQYQRDYVVDYTIMPGDSITTTCTYSAPARFGKSTNDEMCYFFSTHWPAGGLSMFGSGTVIHGGNSCLP